MPCEIEPNESLDVVERIPLPGGLLLVRPDVHVQLASAGDDLVLCHEQQHMRESSMRRCFVVSLPAGELKLMRLERSA